MNSPEQETPVPFTQTLGQIRLFFGAETARQIREWAETEPDQARAFAVGALTGRSPMNFTPLVVPNPHKKS